ncbi:hypothetical protein HY469_04705 [Candidatus Roizmanbacteria bacterium]|nr:hypothetical protein [Candidatus Roizmanbacteria bacterium]
MHIESLRLTHQDKQESIIPPDKALIVDGNEPYVVGLVVHKPAHTYPDKPHAFVGLGVEWNRDRLLDHHALFIYVYPHRDLSETCRLLEIDMASLPFLNIEFIVRENSETQRNDAMI